MTDDTWPPPPGDDAELSAYLAGDLDDLAARRLEARLAEDPALAARLDQIADILAELRAVDTVEPPEGLAERVQTHVAPVTIPPEAPASPRGETIAQQPAAATRGRRFVQTPRRLGAVAAAVAAVALVGGITLLTSPAGDDVAEEAEDRMTTLDDAQEEAPAPDADEAPEAAGDGPQGEEARPDAESGVAEDLVDDPRDDVATSSAVSDAQALLGTPADDADAAADEQWTVLAEGPPLQDGSDPSACRLDLRDDPADVVVPVAVVSGTLDGREVASYLVAAGADGPLERVEVVTVEASTCRIVDRRSLDGP